MIDILPIGTIIAAAVSPRRFCMEVYFDIILPEQVLDIDWYTEGSTIESFEYHMIFCNLKPIAITIQVLTTTVIKILKNVPSFIGEILSGEPCSIIEMCLELSS